MRRTNAPSPGAGMHSVVRRARLEHLAAELLRSAGMMRLPVPIATLAAEPPANMWAPPAEPIRAPSGEPRLALARHVARKTGESQWALKLRVFGAQPFTDADVELFATALLLPSTLLATLNAAQRTPGHVARLFDVPERLAATRLAELGYSAPNTASDRQLATVNETTQ